MKQFEGFLFQKEVAVKIPKEKICAGKADQSNSIFVKLFQEQAVDDGRVKRGYSAVKYYEIVYTTLRAKSGKNPPETKQSHLKVVQVE